MLPPESRAMILTKLKQSGFILTTETGASIAFDPGSETPTEALSKRAPLSAVFVSHQHTDHLHAPNLAAATSPVFVAADIPPLLEGDGLDVTPLEVGKATAVESYEVTPFIVDHGEISAPIVNQGFLIEAEGRRILFLGDIAVPGEVPQGPFDTVLIPVGGGKVFSPEEAMTFLGSLGPVSVVLPVHFNGRSSIDTARAFERLASATHDVHVLELDESITI